MSILFECVNHDCGASQTVLDKLAGQPVNCRQCGQAMTVPHSTSSLPATMHWQEEGLAGQANDTTRVMNGHDAASSHGMTPGPERIGRFQVIRPLGMGGFGAVYLARDPQLDRDVALKIPRPGTLDDPEVKERFYREAKAAARLRHPYIVPVYDAGEDQGQHYIASAYIKGKPLNEVIGGKPCDPRLTAGIVQKLAEALHYAQTQGIIHRDVKPHNVIIAAVRRPPSSRSSSTPVSAAEPHLMDFGLARLDHTSAILTQDGAIMGSPAYMSPEQAGGIADRVTAASDQYSLGVVLYEMLTGRVPFKGQVMAVLSQVKSQPMERPSKFNPGIPRDLETICLKATAKDPAARYATCAAFADDLERWRRGEPIAARRTGPVERLVRWCRREPQTAGLVSAVFLAVLIGASVATGFGVVAERRARQLQDALVTVESEKSRADEKAEEAVMNERVALSEKSRADQQANDALRSERIAQSEKQKAYQSYYVSQMNLASSDWELASIGNLRDRLEKTQPEHTGQDFRGFEWHFWNRQTQGELALFAGHSGPVLSAAFSPDGRHVVTGSQDGTARVWHAGTGQQTLTLKGHAGGVSSAAFSRDGRRIVTAGHDGTARVWDAGTGQQTLTLKGHSGGVSSAAFSPDGRHVVTGSQDGTARVWHAATGQQTLTLKRKLILKRPVHDVLSGGDSSAAFSPDGRRIVTNDHKGTVLIWDAETGQESLTLKGHPGIVWRVEFSPDGLHIVTAGRDGWANVWDAGTGQGTRTLYAHVGPVRCASFSPDGRHIVTGGEDRKVHVWDVGAGQGTMTLKGHAGPIMSVSFSPDGRRVVTASQDGTARVWDARTGQEPLTLKGSPGNGLLSTSFSPDGRRIVTASMSLIQVWDAGTGQETLKLTRTGRTGPTWSTAFSPDGRHIVTGSIGVARVWDAKTGQETLTLTGHAGPVWSAFYNQDGRRLVTASQDGTARVWDAGSGQETLTLKGHAGGVSRASFSPDGRRVVTGGQDGTARVWDAWTGQETLTLKGHAGNVSSALFSPDGRHIVTSGQDGTAWVWDAGTGRETLTLKGHAGPVRSVSFSPDGRRLVTSDSTVRVWDARPWTHALKTEYEALGLVRFHEHKHKTLPELQQAIRQDITITEPVRQKALEFAGTWKFTN